MVNPPSGLDGAETGNPVPSHALNTFDNRSIESVDENEADKDNGGVTFAPIVSLDIHVTTPVGSKLLRPSKAVHTYPILLEW